MTGNITPVLVTETAPAPADTPVSTMGSTPGPTPTLIPPDACPPFAYDSLAVDIAGSTGPAGFIGRHYDSLAYTDAVDGYQSEMLDDVHAWEDLHTRTLHYEFLERMVCRNASGSPFFEVKDAQILNLAVDQSITRTCWESGNALTTVLAAGKIPEGQPLESYQGVQGLRYGEVDMVFLMDMDSEHFVTHPTEGVVCFAPFEGGD
jgi:hypothetical protein